MQMFSVSSTIDLCDLQLVPAKSYLAMATHIQHSGGVHIAYILLTSPFTDGSQFSMQMEGGSGCDNVVCCDSHLE